MKRAPLILRKKNIFSLCWTPRFRTKPGKTYGGTKGGWKSNSLCGWWITRKYWLGIILGRGVFWGLQDASSMKLKRKPWSIYSIVAFSPPGYGTYLPLSFNKLTGTEGVSLIPSIIGEEIFQIMILSDQLGP